MVVRNRRLVSCSLRFSFPFLSIVDPACVTRHPSPRPALVLAPQLGPEGVLINELEGNAPQKVIADVRLTCEEEFVLEDESGNVVHRNDYEGPVVRKRKEV